MEIERVNDYTFKFFISYRDIENRGFDREEIWYDRERGEELFWEMMDEAANEGDFELEGPLWIQVQAFEKGLEIIVTKAKLSQDGSKLELPVSEDKEAEISIEYHAERPTKSENKAKTQKHPLFINDQDSFVIKFKDFEDAIRLAHTFEAINLHSDLYSFENAYYLYIVFDENEAELETWRENMVSQMLEFGLKSKLTVHRLQEYGKNLMKDNALQQIKDYFKL